MQTSFHYAGLVGWAYIPFDVPFWWASGLAAFLHFWFPVEAMLVPAEVLFLDVTNLAGERE
jgi:hypothetical protein